MDKLPRHSTSIVVSKLGRETKWRRLIWCYFRDFVAAQKIEDLTETKNVCAELFQIISRLILTLLSFWSLKYYNFL